VKNYASYLGRNPKTGEEIEVKERRLPFFKVGRGLRDRMNHQ
jgi:integration host factor subunit beta